jgi:hypothetical protein
MVHAPGFAPGGVAMLTCQSSLLSQFSPIRTDQYDSRQTCPTLMVQIHRRAKNQSTIDTQRNKVFYDQRMP